MILKDILKKGIRFVLLRFKFGGIRMRPIKSHDYIILHHSKGKDHITRDFETIKAIGQEEEANYAVKQQSLMDVINASGRSAGIYEPSPPKDNKQHSLPKSKISLR